MFKNLLVGVLMAGATLQAHQQPKPADQPPTPTQQAAPSPAAGQAPSATPPKDKFFKRILKHYGQKGKDAANCFEVNVERAANVPVDRGTAVVEQYEARGITAFGQQVDQALGMKSAAPKAETAPAIATIAPCTPTAATVNATAPKK